ncbi:P-loop containing nucleoside triphosphate hydrolase protein [Geranomyces variabilis]|nr:P-loop containing nucleoside triphosphate hydrolase protein [Geranomyces variabilis]KAJ3143253.1 hypothetical protein HDU90_000010 [Geranomyces variabilis]
MTIAASSAEGFPVSAFGSAGERVEAAFEILTQRRDDLARLPIELVHTILLTGVGGGGKRTLIRELCQKFGIKPLNLSNARLHTQFPGTESEGLASLLRSCCEAAQPTVVVISNIHGLLPAKHSSFELLDAVITGLEDLKKAALPVIVFATTSNPAALHPSIAKRFAETITLDLPLPKQRTQLLQWLLASAELQLAADLSIVGQRCHAYTLGDLTALCHAAISRAREKIQTTGKGHLENEDFEASYNEIQVAASQHNYDVTRMETVKWTDIGGHEAVKALLHESVVWFYQNGKAFQKLGISPGKGVLLYGPPGTGKTLLGKAVASESGANFLSISIADLIKGEVGESEKAIAHTFRTARRCSPCVVFIDELEALFSRHDQMGEVGKKLFSQLVLEIDALDWRAAHVVLLCATNHPESLDPSLLRAGRIDRLVAVRPPSRAERADILRAVTSHVRLHEDVDLKEIAARTRGKTGADLRELVRRASLAALARLGMESKPVLQACDFQHALVSAQFKS